MFLLVAAIAVQDEWKSLFNGKDLKGWDTYVGSPGKGRPPRGLNNDPDRVFSVAELDGGPVLRVSGATVGALTSKEEYDDFHFRVEFKWGELTWPPRKDIARDSGIFYFSVGPHGAGGGAWMKSVQSNIMEDDCGSFWGVGGAIVDIEIGDEKLAYAEDPKTSYPVYKRGGVLKTAGPSGGDAVRPSPILETPPGRWHTAEVFAVGGDSIHVFNGTATMVLRNSRHKAGEKIVSLHKGKIQLQSEFAEIYFRKPEVRALREFPDEHRARVRSAGGDETGFAPLLDETRLKDWQQSGPGGFRVKDGVATGGGGPGLWWYKGGTYGNFSLRGEFLQEPGSSSGVFVRFPDPAVAAKQGHEIEIGENIPGRTSTGSILGFQGPTWLPLKPEGEWNAYEIVCVDRTYEVWLNGRLVNRYTDPGGGPSAGHVGLENRPSEKAVHHRRLRIKELPTR